MSYLVDTNVVSELRKRERAAPSVIKWFKAREPRELFMSVLTVGELRHGVERLRVRDPEGAAALDAWVDGVLDRYRDRLLAVDAAVAEHWSRLGVRDPLPDVDGLIAATALVHDFVVVTRNTRHVAPTGARCFDPFRFDVTAGGAPC